jgi:hypothetical protein
VPQKRNEVVERFDAGELLPDVYENWLKKQPAANAKAKSGFISSEAELDREEDKIDVTEDAHEKAKRRKRGRTGR